MTDVEYLMQSVTRGLAEILVSQKGMTLEEALQTLRASKTHELLMDPETHLYRESPAYVYEYLKEERGDGAHSGEQ